MRQTVFVYIAPSYVVVSDVFDVLYRSHVTGHEVSSTRKPPPFLHLRQSTGGRVGGGRGVAWRLHRGVKSSVLGLCCPTKEGDESTAEEEEEEEGGVGGRGGRTEARRNRRTSKAVDGSALVVEPTENNASGADVGNLEAGHITGPWPQRLRNYDGYK